MNTTGDTRDHDDAAEAACHAAAAAAGKTADQADNCEDGEHKCPSCPFAKPSPMVDLHKESKPCPECGATMLYDDGEPWDGPTWGCTGCGHSENVQRPAA